MNAAENLLDGLFGGRGLLCRRSIRCAGCGISGGSGRGVPADGSIWRAGRGWLRRYVFFIHGAALSRNIADAHHSRHAVCMEQSGSGGLRSPRPQPPDPALQGWTGLEVRVERNVGLHLVGADVGNSRQAIRAQIRCAALIVVVEAEGIGAGIDRDAAA